MTTRLRLISDFEKYPDWVSDDNARPIHLDRNAGLTDVCTMSGVGNITNVESPLPTNHRAVAERRVKIDKLNTWGGYPDGTFVAGRLFALDVDDMLCFHDHSTVFWFDKCPNFGFGHRIKILLCSCAPAHVLTYFVDCRWLVDDESTGS